MQSSTQLHKATVCGAQQSCCDAQHVCTALQLGSNMTTEAVMASMVLEAFCGIHSSLMLKYHSGQNQQKLHEQSVLRNCGQQRPFECNILIWHSQVWLQFLIVKDTLVNLLCLSRFAGWLPRCFLVHRLLLWRLTAWTRFFILSSWLQCYAQRSTSEPVYASCRAWMKQTDGIAGWIHSVLSLSWCSVVVAQACLR